MSTAPLEVLQEGKMVGRTGGKGDTQQANRACGAGIVAAACSILPTSSSIIKHLSRRMDHST